MPELTAPSKKIEPQRSATGPTPAIVANRFSRFWAIGLVILILVTYPIWVSAFTRQPGFPRVSWIALPEGGFVSWLLECTALAGLLIGITAILWFGCNRWAWWGIAVALGVLIAFDQHRLQPWAYQSLLYAIVLGGMPWQEGRKWLIAIAVSIYFYSAMGKLDYQFVHTVGRQMVQSIAGPLGGLGDETATKLAFTLPVGELAIAILVAIPRTRRIGGIGAIAMHFSLIGLLGPWSLGHSLGVLVWNGLLAVQSALLFVAAGQAVEASDPADEPAASVPLRWAIRLSVTAAIVLPLSERFGYWDHWTSWALYSPHSSRAEIQIHRSAFDRMPDATRHYLVDDVDGDGWSDLDIQRWSLQQRLVPIYPQARYQLALAIQLAKRYKLDQAIRVKSKSVSDRWTGGRRESFHIGENELDREMNRYWLGGMVHARYHHASRVARAPVIRGNRQY